MPSVKSMRVRTVQLPSSVPKSISNVSPGTMISSSQLSLHAPFSWVRNEVTLAVERFSRSNFHSFAAAAPVATSSTATAARSVFAVMV